jgi:hypothetical protein
MEPTVEVLHAIDRICDDFEDGLRHDSAPSIREIVDRFDPPWQGDLLTALVSLDVEHRLRSMTAPPPDTMAVIAHYCDGLGNWLHTKALSNCLFESSSFEFELRRTLFGRPDFDSFVENSPLDDVPLRVTLWRRLNELNPTQVFIGADFVTPLDKRLVFGRQQRHQPMPICRLPGEPSDHIVMASLARRHLSRSQVILERISATEVRARNAGSRNTLYVNTSTEVAPGEALLVEGPLLVQVRECSIQVTPLD